MTVLSSVAQTLAIVFWLVTAFYAVLASQPFAFEQFLRPELVPALAWFARAHQVVCLASLAVYLAAHGVAGTWRRRSSCTALFVTGVVWVLACVAAFVNPLADLSPGTTAQAASFLALLPVLLVAAVDLAAAHPVAPTAPTPRHMADFVACFASGVLAAAISAAVAVGRGATLTRSAAADLATSTLLHLVLFLAIFLGLMAARSLGALTRNRRVEAAAMVLLLTGGFFLFLWRTVLPTVVADEAQGAALAVAFSTAIALAAAARGLRVSSDADDPVQRVTGALSPRVAATWPGLVGWLAIVAGGAWLAAAASATVDWNFVVADIGVAGTWLLVLATSARFVRVRTPGRPMALLAATALVLAVNVAWTNAAAGADAAPAPAGHGVARRWTTLDPAARFLADAVRPDATSADEGLMDLLQRHTNLPAGVDVPPVDVSLGSAGQVQPYRPHIFLLVVDSLRRDYVGAYNKAVVFTPSLDAFARENVAFARAFTRYGATGLAVPSIWTGGMLLHKQYTRPFPPMNTLAKLLAEQQYEQWVGLDYIMDTILPASDRRVPLDRTRTVKDFRLCRTLAEIRERLAARSGDDPVFAYTLSQDIHVSAVARAGSSSPDTTAYPGFYAPVASRIQALDRCFGEFITDLETRGLYDDSVVIVTSDHGDSLGEDGRMGHAYTLFPEIVQIPLLVHLPARLAASLEAENDGLAFSTDIAPTLHAVLGVQARQPRAFFGRPLFRARGSRPRGPDATVPVIAASYGAVYAALLDQGSTLYVLDTINLREDAFALNSGQLAAAVTATPALRDEGQRAIRATVQDIADFYGFTPDR